MIKFMNFYLFKRISKILLFVVLLVLGCLESHAVCANSENITEEELRAAGCYVKSRSCLNDTSPQLTSFSQSNTDPITMTIIKNLADPSNPKIIMNETGNINTEGAYIKCTSSNKEECLEKGRFEVVSDICQATPNSDRPINVSNRAAFCPLTKCDTKSPNINFKVEIPGFTHYGTIDLQKNPDLNGWISKDEKAFFINSTNDKIPSEIKFRIIRNEGLYCLALHTPAGYYFTGCKNAEKLLVPQSFTPCFSNPACAVENSTNSKFPIPISSRIVECVRGVIDNALSGTSKCKNGTNFDLLGALQSSMRTTVMAALILYVILTGMKIATASEVPKSQELIMYAAKIILVLYFSVGIKVGGVYQNGIKTYIFDGFFSIMNSFSMFAIQAMDSPICNYSKEIYKPGFEYLKIWDSLDCKIMTYTGIMQITQLQPINSGAIVVTQLISSYFGLFGLIFPLIFSGFAGGLITILGLTIFGLLITSIAIFFLRVFLISIVMLGILTFFSVIFVPFSLFSYTKEYFKKWLDITFSFAIQPSIVAIFMVMIFMIFDNVMFRGCFDQSRGINYFEKINVGLPIWRVKAPSSSECANSIGYIINDLGNALYEQKELLVKVKKVVWTTNVKLAKGIGELMLFCIICYIFADNIAGFSAKLSAGVNLSKFTGSATESFNKVMEFGKKMAEKSYSAKAGKPPAGQANRPGAGAPAAQVAGIGGAAGAGGAVAKVVGIDGGGGG